MAQPNFQFRWVVGAQTAEEGIAIAEKFTLKDVAKNIRCPFLVTHGGNDRVVPVENAPKLYEAVGSASKTIKIFTAEEGGAEQPMSTTGRSASTSRPTGSRRTCGDGLQITMRFDRADQNG